LIKYTVGQHAALGQRKVSASLSVQVVLPTRIYVKREAETNNPRGERHLAKDICFVNGLERPEGSGWECKKMKGEIEWWFVRNLLVITFHSVEG
jgi:hypothetical protein